MLCTSGAPARKTDSDLEGPLCHSPPLKLSQLMENDMGGESKTEKGVGGKDVSKGGDGEALKTCWRHNTEGKNRLRENSAEYRRRLLERGLTSRGSQPKMAWKPSSRNFDSTTNTTTLELWYVPKRTPVVFSSNNNNNDDWVTSEDMWSDKFKNA